MTNTKPVRTDLTADEREEVAFALAHMITISYETGDDAREAALRSAARKLGLGT